ncbi:hypothetical protein BGZ76_007264 [Entomortierella beljakovae]|nr:hypothetical protein BGZ76_007264 [Entomortierella beljakovae]
MARYIDKETKKKWEHRDTNTVTARKITPLIFLSRIIILKYCLSVPGCRETFSSRSWAMLQVCPVISMDVFSTLFNQLLSHLDHKTIAETTIWAISRNEFVSVKEQLISMNYPNFSNNTKLNLVVDEAQILGDQGDGFYVSSSSDSEPRPVLSPILHGFRDPAERSELTEQALVSAHFTGPYAGMFDNSSIVVYQLIPLYGV